MSQPDNALQPLLIQANQAIALAKANDITLTPALVRSNFEALAPLAGQGPSIAKIYDAVLPNPEQDISVRVYAPETDSSLDVMVYFHGGGHMCGSVALYDPICRRLSATSNIIVVAVEYRLAPEHPYPAAINDGYHVCCNYQKLLSQHQLSGKLIVAGDSAGGAMAALLAQKSQCDPQLDIALQVLIYPSLDYTFSGNSYRENSVGYLLETEKIHWYFNHYFQHNEDARQMSPLFNLVDQRLPPALILCAGFDPLRDEAHAYRDKLTKAQVKCELHQFDTMIHAFINLDTLVPVQCQALYQHIADFVAEIK